jgi:hypothetical protein
MLTNIQNHADYAEGVQYATKSLQCDPPDYQLVIEHHPTPVPGNQFQVQVAERRFSSFKEDER